MPTIDLGSVVGPAGATGQTGATGPQGIQGNPGPNQVTATTSTNLTGILQGNGTTVGAVGTGIEIASTTDINSITDTGWYYWGNTAPTNAPIAYGDAITNAGMCVDANGVDIHQIVYRGGTPNIPLKWERYKHGGNAWSKWYEQSLESMPADTTLHVNAVSGDDSNSGVDASHALKTIAAALNKIPANQAGHSAYILLADGTYSALSISSRNLGMVIIGKESSATTANIKIPGGTVTDNGNCCYIFSGVTFTAQLKLYGHNRLTQFIVSGCVFDGGGLEGRGPYTRVNTGTFRNVPSDQSAILMSSGFGDIYSAHIENTCTTGISASEATVNVSTYSLQNNATTPYTTSYSGRIFVGGRTYQENHGRVNIYSGTQAIAQSTITDVTLSEDYRNYMVLELVFDRGSSDNRMQMLISPGGIASDASYVIGQSSNIGVVRMSNYSGSYSIIRFKSTTLTSLRLIAVYGLT